MARWAYTASFLLLLSQTPCGADVPATAPDVVSIRPRLEKGQKFSLYLLRTDVRTGRPDLGIQGRTPVDLEVLETGPKGHVIAWTLGKSDLIDARGEVLELPAADPMLKIMDGLRLEFELNEEYCVAALRNREQALARIHKVIDLIVDAMPEAEREKLRLAILKVFESTQFLETACSRDVNLFFGVAGGQLPVKGALEAVVEIPLSIGDATLATRQRTRIEKMDDAVIVVTGVTEADPKQAAEAMNKVLGAMAKELSTTAPDGSQLLPEFQFKEESRHVIDRKTGLARSAELKRTAVVVDKSRVQTFKVMLREDWPATQPQVIRFFGTGSRPATQSDRRKPAEEE